MVRSQRQQFPTHQLRPTAARVQKCTFLWLTSSSARIAQLANPMDLANMMAATIEAALKPLREKLEATIIPMQRTIESLQAEFVAMREEKEDEAMSQPVSGAALDTQEAKRFRTGLAA